MGSVSDGHRAGHGFAGLRKRYIRRAQHLAQDTEFRAYVSRFRELWNRDYPIYEVRISDPAELSNFPQHLIRDWNENQRLYDNRIEDFEEMKQNGATPQELLAELHRRTELFKAPARLGMDFWIGQIESAAQRFFPIEDFPNPYPNASHPVFGFTNYFHPAHMFVGIALQTDPRLISDFEALFEPMELEPIDLYPYGPGPNDYIDEAGGESEDDEFEDEREPDIQCEADLQWYLPLYPGITEADIRRAAPAIARRMNEIYGSRTASARAQDLRRQGCTHLEIANRLGLTEQTVSAILRKTGL
jgi:hypothetical protein